MRILVTTDGSELSLRAVPHATRLASALGADVTLLYALDPPRELSDEAEVESAAAVAALAQQRAEELGARVSAPGLSVHVAVVDEGERVADVILRTASAQRARLVVMSTHGAGVVRRVIAGSVATAVLQDARAPVMLVGEHVQPRGEAPPYRIVIATDGSRASQGILPAARALLSGAPPESVHLTLLRVYQQAHGDPPFDVAMDMCRRELVAFRRNAPRRFPLELEVRAEPELGGVNAGILQTVRERAADVIWMATHGHSFRRQVLMGSAALGVVRESPVPVILTRAERSSP